MFCSSKVHFEWKYGGDSVILSGSFNDWNFGHMKRLGERWVIDIELPSGVYYYKYFVNYAFWRNDPEKSVCVDGRGNVNNVVVVPTVMLVPTMVSPRLRGGGDPRLQVSQKENEINKERALYNSQPSLFNRWDYHPNFEDVPPPKLINIMRKKFSSTSTIFIQNPISAPDAQEIVICLSRVLYYKIKQSETIERKHFIEIFSEEVFPLKVEKYHFDTSPDQEDILQFLAIIFSVQELNAVCGVLALAYIDRLLKLTGITLHSTNWRRIVLGALLLASKVWEDLGVWNIDYQYIFPHTTLKDLQRLEIEYLNYLQYTMTLTAGMYAKYFFELRSFSEIESSFPMEPLDQSGAERLEERSRGMEVEEDWRTPRKSKRSYSLDHQESKRPVTLEEFQNKVGKKWQKDI